MFHYTECTRPIKFFFKRKNVTLFATNEWLMRTNNIKTNSENVNIFLKLFITWPTDDEMMWQLRKKSSSGAKKEMNEQRTLIVRQVGPVKLEIIDAFVSLG